MQTLESLAGNLPAIPCGGGAPAWGQVQSALSGAIRYAETSLEAAGVPGARLTRMICTPDARRWTLSFGEHHFGVAVLPDGFSVHSLGWSA